MQNWPLANKVAFGTCAVVLFFGLIAGIANRNESFGGFGFTLGIVCLMGAILASIVAVICSVASIKNWDRGFWLSAGILFLLSGISCGGGVFLQ